jgi:molybdopterin molybdotransferase
MELKDYGVIQDQPDELKRAFATAALECDAIITSGGVSVGEADFTKQIMRELGDVTFWQIAMRPGRPMAFGSIAVNNRPAVLFGLPGNPVAVMVTFYQFVRPTLMAMSSAQGQEPLTIKVKSAEAIRKKPGRTEFQRGILRTADDGSREVLITGSQGSGVLRSMSEADCFIVLGHNQDSIQAGDWVDVMLFEGLI